MLREIIPNEILLDPFIERLISIAKQEAALEPNYNCLKEIEDFLVNIKDKYMFEFINLNNVANPIRFPISLCLHTLIQNRNLKKFYEPSSEDDLYDMLNDESRQIFFTM